MKAENHWIRQTVFLGFVIALCFFIGSCTPTPDPSSPKKSKQPKANIHLVETQLISIANIQQTYESNGNLTYRKFRRIFNQEEGQLIEFPFYEGDKVSQGELLFQLDGQLLRAQLAKTKALLKQAKKNLARVQNLNNKQVASQDTLSQAQTDVDIAKADVSLLNIRLAFTLSHAPFNAIISQRLVEKGDVVQKHTHLLTLVNPSSLIIKASISELVSPKLQQGDQVNITIDALEKQVFVGHIQRIHPLLDQQTHQGIVEIRFDKIPTDARAGQFVRLTFIQASKQGILVPFDSVQRTTSGHFVWLLDDQQKAIKSPVTTGIRLAQSIEIIQGLAPNQQLITRGFLGLSEGKILSNQSPQKELAGEKH